MDRGIAYGDEFRTHMATDSGVLRGWIDAEEGRKIYVMVAYPPTMTDKQILERLAKAFEGFVTVCDDKPCCCNTPKLSL